MKKAVWKVIGNIPAIAVMVKRHFNLNRKNNIMTKSSDKSDKEIIEHLINNRVSAIKSQDIEKAVMDYDENLLMFDVIGELAMTKVATAKERLKLWFATMEKLVNYETTIINISVDNSVSFCNTFNHIVAKTKDGNELDMWWRESLGLEKRKNHWLIVSAHSSVPFDVETGKASTALIPPTNLNFKNSKKNGDLSELVKKIFYAYETKDKLACEQMLTDDFTFTSPNNDDHINKVEYFRKCWEFSDQNPVYTFERISVSDNIVFILYSCKTKTGKKFRNTEVFEFEKNKIKSIEVYFGTTF